ncbi:MAG: SGNH/GDSL hydrolase family protein [bacterium]|nr:MAG: SGNH/GDSL hydrolase family protein [bacterium]
MVKNLLTMLFGVVIALLLAETILRIFPSKYTRFGSDIEYRFDPDIGIILAPDQRGATWARKCYKNSHIRTNSDGFRDDDWEVATERVRVAILGDSFIEGLSVPDGYVIDEQLEKMSGGCTEFMNFGLSGLGTLQEYLLYEKFVRRYKPDLVLLFFVSNDVMDSSRDLRRLARGAGELGLTTGYIDEGAVRVSRPEPREHGKGVIKLKSFLKRHCKLSVALKDLVMHRRRASGDPGGISLSWHVYMPSVEKEWIEAWLIVEHSLVRLDEAVREDGARLIVLTIPEYIRVCHDWRRELEESINNPIPTGFEPYRPINRLEEIASENGIAMVKLEPYFIAYRDEHRLDHPYFYFDCDGHMNRFGHSVLSKAISEALGAHLGLESQ